MNETNQEISCEELRKVMARGDVVLLDVLPSSYFRHSHLPGALNVPLDEISSHIRQLVPDTNTFIVVYCQNDECQAAQKAIQIMSDLGYQNVRDYRGGKDDWHAHGLRLEGQSRRLKD